MSEDKIVIEVNCETGEQISRPMNAEEVAALEARQIESEARLAAEAAAKAEAEALLEAKLAARETAILKLTALGLTEQEISAIIG